ncbi:hypothetical protein [uncultured Jannaschia sp.]|uniref:hypothetical protein n=1 Tax=uncultured Jannaschia sp. TaxID=293347 RepID=UPI00262EA8FA|nr:hypothetical protein [uncultured Jannaschia sp.]
MDLQSILEKKVAALPAGPYEGGLSAVKLHINAAIRHFERAKDEPDETLFTDSVYRCNQAVEGSIKEAYRVLAAKDPNQKRPFDIEKFLIENDILKKKVLDQFKNYRQEWRNPATHDYTLDFDEDEALVAITSVTVFAIVLTDQIIGKTAFKAAASETPSRDLTPAEVTGPLLDLVSDKLLGFARSHMAEAEASRSIAQRYYEFEGVLAGYLSSELSSLTDVDVELNVRLGHKEADVVVSRGSEKIVIDLKLTSNGVNSRRFIDQAVAHSSMLLHEKNVVGAIVLIYSGSEDGEYAVSSAPGGLGDVMRIISKQT